MKILPRYSGSVSFGPVIPPLSSRVPVRRAPLAGCCISGRTVFIVSRGKARRRNRVHALPWLIALCSSGVKPSKASSLVISAVLLLSDPSISQVPSDRPARVLIFFTPVEKVGHATRHTNTVPPARRLITSPSIQKVISPSRTKKISSSYVCVCKGGPPPGGSVASNAKWRLPVCLGVARLYNRFRLRDPSAFHQAYSLPQPFSSFLIGLANIQATFIPKGSAFPNRATEDTPANVPKPFSLAAWAYSSDTCFKTDNQRS
jgi:hypothetical protein